MALKFSGKIIKAIYEWDTGEKSVKNFDQETEMFEVGEFPYFNYYLKIGDNELFHLDFCNLAVSTFVPQKSNKLKNFKGHRIKGVYLYSNPNDKIKDPAFDMMFIVTNKKKFLFVETAENGNGLKVENLEALYQYDFDLSEGEKLLDFESGQEVSVQQIVYKAMKSE